MIVLHILTLILIFFTACFAALLQGVQNGRNLVCNEVGYENTLESCATATYWKQ